MFVLSLKEMSLVAKRQLRPHPQPPLHPSPAQYLSPPSLAPIPRRPLSQSIAEVKNERFCILGKIGEERTDGRTLSEMRGRTEYHGGPNSSS